MKRVEVGNSLMEEEFVWDSEVWHLFRREKRITGRVAICNWL